MNIAALRITMRILGWFGIFLLLIILAFEGMPLLPSDNTLNTFHLAARQRVLEERIVKDTLILAYRPSNEHAQAIAELQTALPVWEEVQGGLQIGDQSMGISPHLPGDMKMLLLQAQPSFAYIDASARKILARPSSLDPTQVSIILQNNQGYYLTMGDAVESLQDDINNTVRIYFWIELVMGLLLLLIWLGFQLATRSLYKRLEDDQTEQGSSGKDKENEDQSAD